MAVYIETITNTYPKSITDIRKSYSEVGFPLYPSSEQLEEYNFAVVTSQPQPEYNEMLQMVQEVTPVGTLGFDYMQTWEINDLPGDQIQERITTSKNNKIEELWNNWNYIDSIIHVAPTDQRKSKRKHDINTIWARYGTTTSLTPAEEANIETMILLQDYTALLNNEIDIQTVEIENLTTEIDVVNYIITFSPIPAGLPNNATISVRDIIIDNEYRLTTLGSTDWLVINNTLTTPKIGDIFIATGTGTGTGTVTPTVSITALVPDEEYTIATVGDSDWNTVGSSSGTVGDIFIATGTGTGTGTAIPSTGTGVGQPKSRLEIFLVSGSFPTQTIC